jgi:hypothetical protein
MGRVLRKVDASVQLAPITNRPERSAARRLDPSVVPGWLQSKSAPRNSHLPGIVWISPPDGGRCGEAHHAGELTGARLAFSIGA